MCAISWGGLSLRGYADAGVNSLKIDIYADARTLNLLSRTCDTEGARARSAPDLDGSLKIGHHVMVLLTREP